MAGSPIKRSRKEQEAVKKIQAQAMAKNRDSAAKLPRTKYTPELGEAVCDLVVSGIPIEDSVLNGTVIAPGVASRMGIAPSSFYKWQKERKEFAEAIARAREESAHRLADRIQQLADVALSDPGMANACRVAADILKWSAMVRNRREYGEKVEYTVRESYAEVLLRIAETES